MNKNLQFVSTDIDILKLSSSTLLEITKDNDAFVVVYSISYKASFNIAIDLLKCVRFSERHDQPVILVGNKSDVVRKRSIRKNKENATPTYTNNPYSDSEKKFAKIHYRDQQSFFQRIFNNIFKKRPENAGSVENLYTPPNLN